LTRLVALTTVLHYRADCDSGGAVACKWSSQNKAVMTVTDSLVDDAATW